MKKFVLTTTMVFLTAIYSFGQEIGFGVKAGLSAGRKRAGFFSSCSRKIPSSVILPLIFRSALQLTPMPTGQEAA